MPVGSAALPEDAIVLRVQTRLRLERYGYTYCIKFTESIERGVLTLRLYIKQSFFLLEIINK